MRHGSMLTFPLNIGVAPKGPTVSNTSEQLKVIFRFRIMSGLDKNFLGPVTCRSGQSVVDFLWFKEPWYQPISRSLGMRLSAKNRTSTAHQKRF